MKINVSNGIKLEMGLNAVQKRSHVRVVHACTIQATAKGVESRLRGLKVPKKYWVGLEFMCDPNGRPFPNAHKGTPESTGFTLLRTASGWFVTAIVRGRCAAHSAPVPTMAAMATIREHMEW